MIKSLTIRGPDSRGRRVRETFASPNEIEETMNWPLGPTILIRKREKEYKFVDKDILVDDEMNLCKGNLFTFCA